VRAEADRTDLRVPHVRGQQQRAAPRRARRLEVLLSLDAGDVLLELLWGQL
jgi:hypothetical protein